MPNQPRANNPSRNIRVEDDLWHAAQDAAAYLDVVLAEEVRDALRALVLRAAQARAAAERQEPRCECAAEFLGHSAHTAGCPLDNSPAALA